MGRKLRITTKYTLPDHSHRSRIEWQLRYWSRLPPCCCCTCALYAGRMLISVFFSRLVICFTMYPVSLPSLFFTK